MDEAPKPVGPDDGREQLTYVPGDVALQPYPAGLDPVRRLRILADGYGMSADDRTELLSVIEEVTVVERADIAAQLEAGDAAFVSAFHSHGGWAPWNRLQAWLATERATFLTALIH